MKKSLTMAGLLLLVMAVSAWAGGGQEEAAQPAMDKIVYLSVLNHDSPDIRPAWAAEFKRITGVDVELKTVSSKDAGDLMMAQFMAGEFPDVIKSGADNLEPLARQEFVIPLDPFIEKSPGMKKLKEMYPTSFAAHSVDGIVYGIPARVGAQRGLWVRTDILDELGLAMPGTLDEFVDVLKAIRDNYPSPDGNPMFPYISKTYHSGYIAVLANYFNVRAGRSGISKHPDEKMFRDGWDSPQFRDYADFMKMLYAERLMDPEHLLPQKASKTRSKLYAGKGAFIAMWVKNYASMIGELRKNFPDAELALVPPIENPDGGVLGLSILPGYRPYCIMSATKNPQFVWDNFIEPIVFDTDAAMLVYRGIPDVNYRIVDNTFTGIEKETGSDVITVNPLNPDIKFPYKLEPLLEKGEEWKSEFNGWIAEYGNDVVWQTPSKDLQEYNLIADDLGEVKNQLFWKYVMGELTFDQMMDKYEVYKKEINFQSCLDQFNEGL